MVFFSSSSFVRKERFYCFWKCFTVSNLSHLDYWYYFILILLIVFWFWLMKCSDFEFLSSPRQFCVVFVVKSVLQKFVTKSCPIHYCFWKIITLSCICLLVSLKVVWEFMILEPILKLSNIFLQNLCLLWTVHIINL